MPDIGLPSAGLPSATPAPPNDWLAREYEAAMEHLRKPKRLSQGVLLIGTLALFLLVQQSNSLRALLILVAVLIFHESGHFVGMRLFGYRDVRVFFIPFFGAAVSGRRGDVAAWKEGIVLLLGPAPGILLGFAIGFGSTDHSTAAVTREIGLTLIGLNLFNLLPLGGLDGARLLQLILFSRRRWLEIAFQLVTGFAAAVMALTWQSFGLGLMAYFMLIVLPFRWRVLKAADRMTRSGISLPTEAAALDAETARALFTETHNNVTVDNQRKPATIASAMQQVMDAANAKRPSLEASIALGTALFVVFVLGVAALFTLATPPAA